MFWNISAATYFLFLKQTTVRLLFLSSPMLKLVSLGNTSVTLWIKYRWKPPRGWNIKALKIKIKTHYYVLQYKIYGWSTSGPLFKLLKWGRGEVQNLELSGKARMEKKLYHAMGYQFWFEINLWTMFHVYANKLPHVRKASLTFLLYTNFQVPIAYWFRNLTQLLIFTKNVYFRLVLISV